MGRAGIRRARLFTVAIAMIAAFAVWLVAGPLAGLVAWALAAALEWTIRRPRLIWTAIAAISLALSTTGPLALGVGGAATGALLTMHYVVGGALIAGIGATIHRR